MVEASNVECDKFKIHGLVWCGDGFTASPPLGFELLLLKSHKLKWLLMGFTRKLMSIKCGSSYCLGRSQG